MKKIFNFFLGVKKTQSVFFFTDCADPNALARVQANLVVNLPNRLVFCHGVDSWQEAALNISNVIEVWVKSKSTGNIVVGNIAPRQDKTWINGAPFCFVWVSGNLVVATPQCFAVLSKQGLIPGGIIYQTDVFDVCSKFMNHEEAEAVSKTQFRSLWYVPMLLKWITSKNSVPFSLLDKIHIPQIKSEVLVIDCFGNIKLPITKQELLGLLDGAKDLLIHDRRYDIPTVYDRLSDIPSGCIGFVVGSGGGWTELMINGGSAGNYFAAKVGEEVYFS